MNSPAIPAISVIIVSYRTGDILFECLQSCLAVPEITEIIVVNNGNPDGDEDRIRLLASQTPRLHLIEGHGNIGFGKAVNLGVRHATAEYILVLNPDCVLKPEMAGYFIEAAQTLPAPCLVGALFLDENGKVQRATRRNILNPTNAIVEWLGLYRLMPTLPRLNLDHTPMPSSIFPTPAISGAAMFMRRLEWQKLGGMDERYFLHVEDMDFCRRVQESGGSVIIDPRIRIYHQAHSSDASSVFVEECKAKSLKLYYHKYYPHLMPFLRIILYAGIAMKLYAVKLRARRKSPHA